MNQAAFERQAVVRVPNELLGHATLALTVLGAGSIVGAALGYGLFAAFVQFCFGGPAMRNRVYRENWRAKERGAMVRVTEEGVFLDERLAHAAALVADGYVVSRAGQRRGARLLDTRGRVLAEIEVDTEEEASTILSALGLAASRRRARFDVGVGGWTGRQWNAALVLMFVAVAVLMFGFRFIPGFVRVPPFFFFLMCGPAFMVPVVLPAAFEIGVDGLFFRWLWMRRFISFEEIRGVEASKRGVKISLESGRHVDVALTGNEEEIAVKREAVLARVGEAIALHRSVAASRELAARLARGTRTVGTWRRALEAVRDAQAGYREGAVRDEDLWLVVEDASAPEDARAAAAVLLREGGEPARVRIRIAAETTVSPRLRLALGAAASDADSAALDGVLADLDVPLARAGTRERS